MKEVTVTVKVNDAENAILKLQQLQDGIEKAKTAAVELAVIIKELRIKVEMSPTVVANKINEDVALSSEKIAAYGPKVSNLARKDSHCE